MFQTPFHKENLSKSSFLVTGGAGFIGSNLVEYLLKYNAGKVKVLDNLSTGFYHNIAAFEEHPSFEFIEGDIRNPEICQKACEGVDIVFHQAALGSVPRSINDPITSNDVNVNGFLNMLVAVKDQSVKRMVFASSSSVYGDNQELPKIEDKVGNALSPYSVSKKINEMYADVFSKIYGVNLIGLRYFNVFGPRQNVQGAYAAVIPRFIEAFLTGGKVIFHGDGSQSRDFTFVENAVQANIKAAFTDNPKALNTIYNAAFGETISLVGVFKKLQEISGNMEIQPEIHPKRVGDIQDSLANISKAKSLLGYEPAIKVSQGLEITFNWYKFNLESIKK
jgi:UDP-N-acetylglucosamine 4-epimerase